VKSYEMSLRASMRKFKADSNLSHFLTWYSTAKKTPKSIFLSYPTCKVERNKLHLKLYFFALSRK